MYRSYLGAESGSHLRQPSQAQDGVKEESGYQHRFVVKDGLGFSSGGIWAGRVRLSRSDKDGCGVLSFFGRWRGSPRASLREISETEASGWKGTSRRSAESQHFLSVEEGPWGLVSERNLRQPSQVLEGRRRSAECQLFSTIQKGPERHL